MGKTDSYRVSHVQSIPAREERRARKTITPARHRAFTPAGTSPATITPPCATGAQRGTNLFRGVRPQPAATFDELILIAGSTRSALRSWQPGAHRRRPSSAPSAGSGGLVFECAARNCKTATVGGIVPLRGNQISGVEAEKWHRALSWIPHSPREHDVEFIDLGKADFLLFRLNSH